MHILIIHQIFVTPKEGGGTRHYELARSLVQMGHRVTVVASNVDYLSGRLKCKKQDYLEGINIIYSRTYSALHKNIFWRGVAFFSFAFSSFLDGMKVSDVDVVWGTSPPLFQVFTAWLVSFFKRKPFIFEVRDLWLDFAKDLGVVKSKFLYNIFKVLERFLYKRANKLIVNSPGFIPYIKAFVAIDDIALVPNGVSIEEFENIDKLNMEKIRAELLVADKFVVMYTGNMGVANDLDTIIDAAEKLKDMKDIVFYFVGGGMRKLELEKSCKDKKIKNVIFVGSYPKEHIPAVIDCADVCIATLKDIELFKTTYPNKIFDYMAASKPIVLGIEGVIKDVVEKANCAICVRPGSVEEVVVAIETYCKDQELRNLHSINGHNYVKKHFERQRIARKLEVVLKELVYGK